jgi:hypothetical protein
VNIPEPYAGVAAQVFARCQAGGAVTYSRDVAEAVWRAATDPACPMRLPAGADASHALRPNRPATLRPGRTGSALRHVQTVGAVHRDIRASLKAVIRILKSRQGRSI